MAGLDPPPGDPGEGGSRHPLPPIRWPANTNPNGQYRAINGTFVVRLELANGAKFSQSPFVIQRSVESHIGDKVLSATPEGRGTALALTLRNEAQAIKLMNLKQLTDNTEIKITPHPHRNTVRCVVSDFDTVTMDEESLKAELANQGVIAVKRIQKNVNGILQNTPAMILTMNNTIIPSSIKFGLIIRETRPYYQAPMMCYKCWAFGHTKTRCTNAICGQCAQPAHTQPNENCLEAPHCSRCNSGSHSLSSRRCPVYEKEDKIQRIRTDRNLSYPQAKKEWEAANGSTSYAKTTAQPTAQDTAIDSLNKKVDAIIHALTNRSQLNVQQSQDTRFDELTNKLELVIADNLRKDEQIRTLTRSLNTMAPPNECPNTTQNQETIQELLSQVKNLREALKEKDATIARLAGQSTKTVEERNTTVGSEHEPLFSDTDICTNYETLGLNLAGISDSEVDTSQSGKTTQLEEEQDMDTETAITKRNRSSSRESAIQTSSKKPKPKPIQAKSVQTGKANKAKQYR